MREMYNAAAASTRIEGATGVVGRSLRAWGCLLPALRAVMLLLAFAGFLTPASAQPLGGLSTLTGGTPNPGHQPYSKNSALYVNAYTAQVDKLAWPDFPGNQTVNDVIQLAMNAELGAANKPQNWPLPVTGKDLTLTFTVNTQAAPFNYVAADFNLANPPSDLAGAIFNMTSNMPTGEHWLQLVQTNYLAGGYTAAATWPDPNSNGYWLIDNLNSPGQPFYDLVPNSPAVLPNFADAPNGPWNGTSFFHAYLFVADMDQNNVITLHDVVTYGWDEPEVAVPEPSTLSLLGLGVLGLLRYARRRKATAEVKAGSVGSIRLLPGYSEFGRGSKVVPCQRAVSP